MSAERFRIGIVAPGSRIEPALVEKLTALAQAQFGDRAPELLFHPQCFLASGHFAGNDETRAAAFLDIANDANFDALWFARGGYGSARLASRVLAGLNDAARHKTYLGYSDAGSMLAALYTRGFQNLAHGPMAADLTRNGGEEAVVRALSYLVDAAPDTLEPSVMSGHPTAAFNIMILSHLIGTPLQPDLTGHVLMLEEVSEYMYRIDRDLLHIMSNPDIRKVAGVRLGRWSPIPPNEPDFGQTEEEVIKHQCEVAGIAYLGRADIGHDVHNKIVPFGRFRPSVAA
jgi:muramoyltetrapeptide carboxypeptidase